MERLKTKSINAITVKEICDSAGVNRATFYKHYKDEIIDFEPLPDGILKKYIQKEIALSDKSCQKLIDICEHDYGRILLEIDKIKRYVDIDKCR